MTWYWFLWRRNYHRDPHGIALYADKGARVVAADGLERLKKAESDVYELLGECKALARKIRQKWNKLRDLGSEKTPFVSPVTPDEYENLRLRVSRDRLLLAVLVCGETYLNYLTLMVIIGGAGDLLVGARVAIALVITIGIFKLAHWALAAWDPNDRAHLHTRIGAAVVAVFGLAIVGGITTARAHDFEGGQGNNLGVVGLSFVGFSLILPIIAGIIDLSLSRIIPVYRRVRKWRAALKDLRKFEGRMQTDLKEMAEKLNRVATHSLEHAHRMYAGITDFKVIKNYRDKRAGSPPEDLTKTLAHNVDDFVAGCMQEYLGKRKEFEASIAKDVAEVEDLVNRSIELSSDLSTDAPPLGEAEAPVLPSLLEEATA